MRYDRVTLWLHGGFAAGVSTQLLVGLMMQAPRVGVPVDSIGHHLFAIHRMIGIFLAIVLAVHWAWQLAGRASNGMANLFPWFHAKRRSAVWRELKLFATFRYFGTPKRMDNLAGAVHGLGLLTGSFLALTGLVLYYGLAPDGGGSAATMAVEHLHYATACLMWTFMGGHVLMSFRYNSRVSFPSAAPGADPQPSGDDRTSRITRGAPTPQNTR